MRFREILKRAGLIFDVRRFPMDVGRICCLPLQLFFRLKTVDTDGKKKKLFLRGAAVIAPNHPGFMDPLAVICMFWYRRVFAFAGESLMNTPLKNLLLRGMGCIKVDRTRYDIEAIRKGKSVLDKGRPLTVFVQGGIHRDSSLGELKSGAVLLAAQAGVPLIPMYSGRRKHWYERRLYVIGDSFDCCERCGKSRPGFADIEKMTAEVHDELEKCREVYERLTGGTVVKSEEKKAAEREETVK